MTTILRSVGGLIAGLLVAFGLVVAVELFSSIVHPLPPDFGGTQEEIGAHVERYPAWVLAVVVPAWAATAFAGTWIAGRVANRRSAALVGLLTVAALVFNLSMLPYPIWFKVGCLIAIPGGIILALLLSGRPSAAAVEMAG